MVPEICGKAHNGITVTGGSTMVLTASDYKVISADCHIDLCWLPPDLFTSNSSQAMKGRMPYVTDGPDGPQWVSNNGGYFGLVNGVGPAGAKYVPARRPDPDPAGATQGR